MSYRQKPLLTLAAVVAAMALLLTGCGGGSSMMEEPEVPEVPVTPPPPPAPANLTELFAQAQNASAAAVSAGEAATAAQKSATDSAEKLTTMEVAGDSSAAMMNAHAILTAQSDAAQAVMDAKAALDSANAAKMAAEDIADDHPQKDALTAAIDAAIEEAEAQVKAATDIRDGDPIKNAVAEVTGGEDADPQGTPRSIANIVGMDIAMALLPTSVIDGTGTRHTHGTASPADTVADELKVEMDDRVGQTWAEIVGETTKMRIATSGTDTNEVDAASVDGMTLTSAATVTATDAFADDGLQVDATYKGIAGTIFCVGSDCTVTENADDTGARDLGGSWYFTPTAPMERWLKNADETGYVAETLFTSYGYWLSVADQGNTDPTDDEWTVTTFATSTISERGDMTTVNTTGDTLTDSSATYSGSAVGMSVLKADNAAGDGQDVNSGGFTANVTLTAEFAATPMLSGMINGFQGSAVNENWNVTLNKRAFDSNFADGVASATGRDGDWHANAYGEAGQRPTGIYGAFNAHFSDGHAAGAYATRKGD